MGSNDQNKWALHRLQLKLYVGSNKQNKWASNLIQAFLRWARINNINGLSAASRPPATTVTNKNSVENNVSCKQHHHHLNLFTNI